MSFRPRPSLLYSNLPGIVENVYHCSRNLYLSQALRLSGATWNGYNGKLMDMFPHLGPKVIRSASTKPKPTRVKKRQQHHQHHHYYILLLTITTLMMRTSANQKDNLDQQPFYIELRLSAVMTPGPSLDAAKPRMEVKTKVARTPETRTKYWD